jgi:hypothetical protein
MTLKHLIDEYHSLLDDDSARANNDLLTAASKREGIFFGERPLCIVLRPRLLMLDQYQHLQEVCSTVAIAARQVVKYMQTDRSTRELMAFTPGEDAVMSIEAGYDEPSACSRLDSFFDNENGSLQFVEYNAESPAGIAYQDILSEVFKSLPIMQEFGKRHQLKSLPASNKMLEALLAAFKEWGKASDPRIAIVDWTGLPTRTEFEMFQKYFKQHGVETIICAPEDLTYRDKTLHADGQAVNIVYKRVLTSEFLQRFGEEAALEHPLGQAYRDGSIVLVNSFKAKPLHKKMIFGLLSDPMIMDAAQIDPETQLTLLKHIPWTRRVQAGTTTFEGQEIDLIKFIKGNQDRLLLKPNDDYGGHGITIGWETDRESWASAIEQAIEHPFVVQERVHIAYEDYPAYVDGKLHIGQRLVDTDPFLFGTNVQGCLTRLSTVTLLNVTAGGGSTAPAFLVS